MHLLEYETDVDKKNRPVNIYDLNLEKYRFLNKADLSSVDFTKFPQFLGQFMALETLDLSNNRLSICKIPAGLNNLKELYLMSNFLDTYPATVQRLSNLKLLDLSCNEIPSIPDTIENCKQLVKLDISKNLLTSLPDELFNIKKLKYLNLSENSITEVPLMAARIDLYQLDLSCNCITRIPVEARILNRITLFDVSHNPISYPPQVMIKRGSQAFFKYLEDEQLITSDNIMIAADSSEEISQTQMEENLNAQLAIVKSEPQPSVPEEPRVTRPKDSSRIRRVQAQPRSSKETPPNLLNVRMNKNAMAPGKYARRTIKVQDHNAKIIFKLNEILTSHVDQIFSVQDIKIAIINGDFLCLYILALDRKILNKEKIHYTYYEGTQMVMLNKDAADHNMQLFINACKKYMPGFDKKYSLDRIASGDLSMILRLLIELEELKKDKK
ncbi:MAG: hypothetical protein MHMPM18_001786 [Marteilia pararefringens]